MSQILHYCLGRRSVSRLSRVSCLLLRLALAGFAVVRETSTSALLASLGTPMWRSADLLTEALFFLLVHSNSSGLRPGGVNKATPQKRKTGLICRNLPWYTVWFILCSDQLFVGDCSSYLFPRVFFFFPFPIPPWLGWYVTLVFSSFWSLSVRVWLAWPCITVAM